MDNKIPDGVWPTMITPFTEDNEIDYKALEQVIDWYIASGVNGLFAVCQSSEMFYLSLEERVSLARFVVEKSAGRVPVIASGHVSDSLEDQIEEITRISETGIDAFVLVSNRLAAQEEDDEIWKQRTSEILERVPAIPFGIYECPYPYKRLLSPELLKWCADTGRFLFLKDTCCNLEQLRDKIEAVRDSSLKVFNANSATLLESLKLGAAGFSGVMANFHPELYVWLTSNWRTSPDQATRTQWIATLGALIELQYYPINAKYSMQLAGLPVGLHTRVKSADNFLPHQRLEVEQLYQAVQHFSKQVYS